MNWLLLFATFLVLGILVGILFSKPAPLVRKRIIVKATFADGMPVFIKPNVFLADAAGKIDRNAPLIVGADRTQSSGSWISLFVCPVNLKGKEVGEPIFKKIKWPSPEQKEPFYIDIDLPNSKSADFRR